MVAGLNKSPELLVVLGPGGEGLLLRDDAPRMAESFHTPVAVLREV